MMKYVFPVVFCIFGASQSFAQKIELTCGTTSVDSRPATSPVFTAELDAENLTIVWTGPNLFGKRKTSLIIEETQYSWSFECDNSKGVCGKDNGRINRLTGQFDYWHVLPPKTLSWTFYGGECKSGIQKLF